MGWWYSTCERVIPVPVGNGEVVGVRPYTHVWIDPRMEGRAEVRRYVSLGHLQRSGNPGRGSRKQVPAQPVAQKPPAKSGERAFSDSIVVEAPVAKMKPVSSVDKVSTSKSRAAKKADDPEKPKKGRRRGRSKTTSSD